ncbi:MAG: hypothetical protein ACI9AT_001041, partial [Ulvibacter sp.]
MFVLTARWLGPTGQSVEQNQALILVNKIFPALLLKYCSAGTKRGATLHYQIILKGFKS